MSEKLSQEQVDEQFTKAKEQANKPVSQQPSQIEMVRQAEKHLSEKHKHISEISTPKQEIKDKAGMDYVEEKYMRSMLNKYFSVWSWVVQDTQFLGSEWCIVTGELQVMDVTFNRKFGSVGAARIMFKRGEAHTPENVINVDHNVASANTNAFKRAVNRLCNIADDVYRKEMVDYDLSQEQIEKYKEFANAIKSKNKREAALEFLEGGGLHSGNYDGAVKKVNRIIEGEEE